jgi:hypothetical protein
MNRMITTLTVLSFSLGTAAFAATPNHNKSARANSSSVTLSSQNSISLAGDYAADPAVPGATGRAIVPGDHSTIAGDRLATQMERTGAYGE